VRQQIADRKRSAAGSNEGSADLTLHPTNFGLARNFEHSSLPHWVWRRAPTGLPFGFPLCLAFHIPELSAFIILLLLLWPKSNVCG
jgi:hypothetical protein